MSSLPVSTAVSRPTVFLPPVYQPVYQPVYYPKQQTPSPTQAATHTLVTIGETLLPAYINGGNRFFSDLKQHPAKLVPLAAAGVLMAALKTVVPYRHHRWIASGFMLATLIGPVKTAVEQGPKLLRAYQAEKEGSPNRSRKLVRRAGTELGYQVFQVYLRPLWLAEVLYLASNFPRVLQAGLNAPKPVWKSVFSIEGWVQLLGNRVFKLKPMQHPVLTPWLNRLEQLTRQGQHVVLKHFTKALQHSVGKG